MLTDDLKKLITGGVYDDAETLTKYSRDASLFEVRPKVVVAPANVEDVKKLVNYVSEKKTQDNNISLTPRSAGTDMTGGPLNESIIIDLNKNLNKVLEVKEGYAVTEPGVFYRDFEKETLKSDQLMPSYPASREICSVGGMVANNAGGEKTLAYGKVEDYVLELKVVLADGNEYTVKPLTKAELEEKIKTKGFEADIYRKIYELIEKNYDEIKAAKPQVSKNSSGYYLWNVWDPEKPAPAGNGASPSSATKKGVFDLTKLIVGSQGTLGIVTQIKFRLVKTKKHDRLAVVFMKDIKILGNLVNTILKYKPENFESYDDQTLKMGLKYFWDVIKIMKPKNILSLMWSFIPEFWAGLKYGGLPKLILLVEFSGDDEEVLKKELADLHEELKSYPVGVRITKSNEEEAKYWTFRRESFNLLRHHLHGQRTAPFIDDIIVRPEFLPEFLPKLRAVIGKYPVFYTIAGHMGDGNFHIIPLMNLADPKSKDIIIKLSREVYDLVLEYKGSISAEHNDGIIRTPFLKQMFGEKMIGFFAEVKKIFDPQNMFNPGKKVGLPGQGADMKYLEEHIINHN